jgi:hypothetical protein
VLVDQLQQLREAVLLVGEFLNDVLMKKVEIVCEFQRATGKGDARFDLWAQREVVPAESQLPQQLAERTGLRPRLGVIRDRVQADIVVAFSQPIKRIQPADGVVLLDDAHTLVEVGKSNSSSESRETRADDHGVVFHRTFQKQAGPDSKQRYGEGQTIVLQRASVN